MVLKRNPYWETKKDVESILKFFCGHLLPFNDVFRLGRFKGRDSDHPPCPLLVKLSNVLILAAKCNLKDFSNAEKRMATSRDHNVLAVPVRSSQKVALVMTTSNDCISKQQDSDYQL